jgi:SAM-dependent methyltransferase
VPTARPRREIVGAVDQVHWWFVAQREMVRAVLEREQPAGGTLLDVGCGTGTVVADLSGRFDATGVDVDSASLAMARERCPAGSFVRAGAEQLPFADESFDVVLSLDVIGSAGVVDKAQLVREARRVLRPGGTFVLQAAAYDWLRSAHDAAVGFDRRFTLTELRELLVAAGLAPGLATYRLCALFVPAAASRLLRRHGERNQVGPVPDRLNRALTSFSVAENRLARRRPLPFGLSAFIVGRVSGDFRP